MKISCCGDIHVDEDRYFADTAQCLEWFVADAVQASVDLFVINGELRTYKASSGCCQWQGVRAHAAPGHGPGWTPPSDLYLPYDTRLGGRGSGFFSSGWACARKRSGEEATARQQLFRILTMSAKPCHLMISAAQRCTAWLIRGYGANGMRTGTQLHLRSIFQRIYHQAVPSEP